MSRPCRAVTLIFRTLREVPLGWLDSSLPMQRPRSATVPLPSRALVPLNRFQQFKVMFRHNAVLTRPGRLRRE